MSVSSSASVAVPPSPHHPGGDYGRISPPSWIPRPSPSRVQGRRRVDDDDHDESSTSSTGAAASEPQEPLPPPPPRGRGRGNRDDGNGGDPYANVLDEGPHQNQQNHQLNYDYEALDESGEMVLNRFLLFLEHFVAVRSSERELTEPQRHINNNNNNYNYHPYKDQAHQMARKQLQLKSATTSDNISSSSSNNSNNNNGNDMDEEDDDEEVTKHYFASTLLLDMDHVQQYDGELAEALQAEWGRFEPFLRRAIETFVLQLHPQLQPDAQDRRAVHEPQYMVAVYNVAHLTEPQPENDNEAAAGRRNPNTNANTSTSAATTTLRGLRGNDLGRLVSMVGTVTRSSEVRPELLMASFRCQKCGLLALAIPQQYHYTRPTLCRNPRCKNASSNLFVLETASSHFVDWQKLRVQEGNADIPPGCMPRSMDVIVRNEMVEKCKAGDKCLFVGTSVVIPDGSVLAASRAGEAAPKSMRSSDQAATGGGGGVHGLQALGVRELTYRVCFVANCVLPLDAVAATQTQRSSSSSSSSSGYNGVGLYSPPHPPPHNNRTSNNNAHHHHHHHMGTQHMWEMVRSAIVGAQSRQDPSMEEVVTSLTHAERQEIRDMINTPNLYELMVDSIAPTTFGHREIKKGVLLMLLGGIHKTTADGIQLRGDINVCIVGDPSTAKSQFLKYVHAFMPARTVYTSGKASSAAGLTAAVQRDHDTGEYTIEAGALMLADNGICCIDEFDKQDPADQVAIHEAMEQQTISITKAGIQATLNARASILAAANPIYGRYDRTKTLKANIALSAPILSRFDLFFVVLDECHIESDRQVAAHILKVHRCLEDAIRPPYTTDQMRRYIRFARTHNPAITTESQRVLVDCYIKLRQGDTFGRSRAAYRITVRQLESMIRLSEALARLHCDPHIQPSYVREAYRLLKTSIIQVETSDVDVEDYDDDDNENENENENGGDDDANDNDHDGGNDGRGENGNGNAPIIGNDLEGGNDRHDETDTSVQVFPGEYPGEDSGLLQQQQRGEEKGDHNDSSTFSELGKTSTGVATEMERQSVAAAEAAKQATAGEAKKAAKKKTKISFDEYEAIANTIATYLRSLERQDDDEEDVDAPPTTAPSSQSQYLKWYQVVDWYLEQVKSEIGNSEELRAERRKKINLVIRRLLNVDMILVTFGEPPKNKREEQQTVLVVHPNFVTI